MIKETALKQIINLGKAINDPFNNYFKVKISFQSTIEVQCFIDPKFVVLR